MVEKISVGLKKIEIMDDYIDTQDVTTSSEICSIVNSVFGFDLETKPILSKEFLESGELPLSNSPAKYAIDLGIAKHGGNISGAEIRQLINGIFGINLDAISSLDGSRISLFSKEQWIMQQKNDLFVVHTGFADVDVKIFPTDYFIEQTGLTTLPDELQQELTKLGFSYDENIGSFYYSNPTGEAIQDSFKGQTIGSVLKVIQNSYQNI
ncbi:hypothetical protein [Ureibacillus chungkukjangi]|uniref:Uncharacterized protein n=1 Tax=Ureibacillus chungkukjangi TaxID=1202712 RepID=A0A318TVM3_9BACL|nr:hypothetical protein [Ureibacillus chungkukjangi]PYF07920.1 hypothetical protein BJ095_10387 [Ureibacillus chungkukjangi]